MSWVVGPSCVHLSEQREQKPLGMKSTSAGSIFLPGFTCFLQPGWAGWSGLQTTTSSSGLAQRKLVFIHTKSNVNLTAWATLRHRLEGPAPEIMCSSDFPESFAPGTELAKPGTVEEPARHFRGQAFKRHYTCASTCSKGATSTGEDFEAKRPFSFFLEFLYSIYQAFFLLYR